MKTANEMMNEIGAWADIMFPVHLPDHGIVEELGEVMHCILKRAQQIRDMEKDEVFYPALKDAFADVTIYLLHLCFLWKVALSFECMDISGAYRTWTDRQYCARSLRQAAMLLEYMEILPVQGDSGIFRVPTQTLMSTLIFWGKKWDIDVIECARNTWDKNVSKREWNKNRSSADKDVIVTTDNYNGISPGE